MSPAFFEILKKSPTVSYQNLSITHYRITPYQYTDGLSPCIRRQLFGYIWTSDNVRLYTLRTRTLYAPVTNTLNVADKFQVVRTEKRTYIMAYE